MLQALLLSSGKLIRYILYGENAKNSELRNICELGYTILNMFWLIMLVCSFDSDSGLATQFVCIVLTIAYPAIITICSIRNRKRNNKKEE